MTDTVYISNGSYRNNPVTGEFEVVKPLTEGAKGFFITVDGTGHAGLPDKAIRVRVQSPDDIQFDAPDTPVVVRTDEQVIKEVREKFAVLDDMVEASINGIVRGMIVSGPPGIGKSHGVDRMIEEANEQKEIGRMPQKAKFGIEKGAATPIGLYQMLYEYSAKGSVLAFDDSDTILYDETSLNLLKAALDTGKRRRISWRSESRVLESNDIPDNFEFEGSIIFITNLNFEATRGKIGQHLGALMSRCFYLDMGIHGMREKFLRCRQIVQDGMLEKYGFSKEQEEEILNYIWTNQNDLRELSLRTIIKIAELYRMNPDKWMRYADNTCLKGR